MLDRWAGSAGVAYSDSVWRAATSAEAFASFRSDPAYTHVLEHVTEKLGREYLLRIQTHQPLLDLLADSQFADTIGSPATMDVGGRRISPTTARYAKVAYDLDRIFPHLRTCRSIVEIGVGYGGQARILAEFLRSSALETITLVDLYEVLLLTRRYIEHFQLPCRFEYRTKSEIASAEWDLVISNYAFSELPREVQSEYMDKIITRSRAGYLTMNRASRPSAQRYSSEELMRLLPNSRILPEDPSTRPTNYILIFGLHGMH